MKIAFDRVSFSPAAPAPCRCRSCRRAYGGRNAAGTATAATSAGIPKARSRASMSCAIPTSVNAQRPYRWMENDKDQDWLPYLKGQNDHTRAILDKLPTRAGLLKRIQQLTVIRLRPAACSRGRPDFLHAAPRGADNYKLFVRESAIPANPGKPTKAPLRSRPRPHRSHLMSGPAGHVSSTGARIAEREYVVYGLSKNGSEDSTLHILAVADGRDLSERIENTQSASPYWLDDNSGFFYNQLTGAVGTRAISRQPGTLPSPAVGSQSDPCS